MGENQVSDGVRAAWLQGAAIRHASWTRPEGAAREAALAELTQIADGRSDLVAQVAGRLLGFSPQGDMFHPQARIAADLLIEAGADEGLIGQWEAEGWERRDRPRLRG
jgi:hypothetical protein